MQKGKAKKNILTKFQVSNINRYVLVTNKRQPNQRKSRYGIETLFKFVNYLIPILCIPFMALTIITNSKL